MFSPLGQAEQAMRTCLASHNSGMAVLVAALGGSPVFPHGEYMTAALEQGTVLSFRDQLPDNP